MSLESLGSRLGAFGSLMENYLVEWRKQIPENRAQRVTLEALLSDRVGRPPEKATQTQKCLKKKRKIHKQEQEMPQMSISVERKPSFGTPSRDDARPPMPLQPPTRARSAYEIFKLKARHLYPAQLSPEKVEMRLKVRWMQLRLSDKMTFGALAEHDRERFLREQSLFMNALKKHNVADPHEILSRRYSAHLAKAVKMPPEHEILTATAISTEPDEVAELNAIEQLPAEEEESEEDNISDEEREDPDDQFLTFSYEKDEDEEDDDASSNNGE